MEKLTRESLEWYRDTEKILKARHNTLKPKAYGVILPGPQGNGWTVVFEYREPIDPTVGRAVTIDGFGGNKKVQHQDIFLKAAHKIDSITDFEETLKEGTKYLDATFPSQHQAVKNGEAVLSFLHQGSDLRRDKIKNFVGKPIAFFGGVARPGGSANPMIAEDVLLKVDIVPFRDVRTHAVGWTASVLGTLKEVNTVEKTVTIQAEPGNWRVFDTY